MPIVIVIILLVISVGLTGNPARGDTVAFFYALDADFQALKSEASPTRQPVKVGARSIQVLNLEKHRIYAVKMGSGAVETAASAQALLAKFKCDRAFSLGPVGAISDEVEIGKWYRVRSVVAYQKGSWRSNGFELNKAARVELGDEATIKLAPMSIFAGNKEIGVASGEIFIASDNYRQRLHEMTKADAVDMNLFGLISVCTDYHIPLINWRIVSDKADDNASEDFRKFTQKYNGAGGKAVAEVIRDLPPNPNSPESYPELEKLLRKP